MRSKMSGYVWDHLPKTSAKREVTEIRTYFRMQMSPFKIGRLFIQHNLYLTTPTIQQAVYTEL